MVNMLTLAPLLASATRDFYFYFYFWKQNATLCWSMNCIPAVAELIIERILELSKRSRILEFRIAIVDRAVVIPYRG